MNLVVILIILLILFGGVGFHSNWGYYGAGPFGGIGGLLVLIFIIWLVTGGLR
jgi:hypothetical protein